MTSHDIYNLVQQGKMKQVLQGRNVVSLCFSERLANDLVENGATEFANFAYTDYGAQHGNGILDYAVIRFVEENYKQNDGCAIENTGWGGKNMVLYGKGLEWLRGELLMKRDTLDDLLYGLEDIIDGYERENAEKEARFIIESNPDKKFNFVALVWAIRDADSGMNTNGMPDYSERELMSCYKNALEEMAQ